MNSSEWQKQYLQEWDGARTAKLYGFAKDYHDRCEAYDRTVCTGPMGRDGIMPASHTELGKINRYARSVLTEVLQNAEREGFNQQEVLHEISRFDTNCGHSETVNTQRR